MSAPTRSGRSWVFIFISFDFLSIWNKLTNRREANMSRIDEKINELQGNKELLIKRKIEILRRLLIKCPKCSTSQSARKWIFLQHKYWYIPRDWQSGGFWQNHDPHTCHAVCPTCKCKVYIYNHHQLIVLVNHIVGAHFDLKSIFEEVLVGDIEGTNRVIQAVQSGRLKVEP